MFLNVKTILLIHCVPKIWNEFSRADAPELDFVFTLCDSAKNEVCPVWPGQPMTAHWGVPDPATVEGVVIQKRWSRSTMQ